MFSLSLLTLPLLSLHLKFPILPSSLVSFSFLSSSSHLFLPIFSPLLLSSFPPFASDIPTFSTSVSTTFHILLDISSSSLLLFSNQSQDYGMSAMAFLRSHSTSNLLLCISLSSSYVLDNKYLSPLYVLLALLYSMFHPHFLHKWAFLFS